MINAYSKSSKNWNTCLGSFFNLFHPAKLLDDLLTWLFPTAVWTGETKCSSRRWEEHFSPPLTPSKCARLSAGVDWYGHPDTRQVMKNKSLRNAPSYSSHIDSVLVDDDDDDDDRHHHWHRGDRVYLVLSPLLQLVSSNEITIYLVPLVVRLPNLTLTMCETVSRGCGETSGKSMHASFPPSQQGGR